MLACMRITGMYCLQGSKRCPAQVRLVLYASEGPRSESKGGFYELVGEFESVTRSRMWSRLSILPAEGCLPEVFFSTARK